MLEEAFDVVDRRVDCDEPSRSEHGDGVIDVDGEKFKDDRAEGSLKT